VDKKTGREVRVKAADKAAYSMFADTNGAGQKTVTVMVYSKRVDEKDQAPAFQLDEGPDYQVSAQLDFASLIMIPKDRLEKYEYAAVKRK